MHNLWKETLRNWTGVQFTGKPWLPNGSPACADLKGKLQLEEVTAQVFTQSWVVVLQFTSFGFCLNPRLQQGNSGSKP